jgi:hypothetical protein
MGVFVLRYFFIIRLDYGFTSYSHYGIFFSEPGDDRQAAYLRIREEALRCFNEKAGFTLNEDHVGTAFFYLEPNELAEP